MTAVPFTADVADRVARKAAAAAGLAHERTELVRLGSNAILRLPHGVIARVARGATWIDAAEHEVAVAAALDAAGVPCVQLLPVSQPAVIDGYPVTFWVEIPGPLRRPTTGDLGAVIRKLHGADVALPLPPLDPWAHIADRIEASPITDTDRRVLRRVLAEVQDEWQGVRFDLDAGVIHGDAHAGNFAKGADRATLMLDLDTVCTGPREWDLVPTGMYATTLHWIKPGEYRAFVEAYGGYDVTRAPAYPLLCRMRELRMTAWIAQHAAESDRLAAEVAHRVACLADPDLPRRWSAR
jgi:hypothetical protein